MLQPEELMFGSAIRHIRKQQGLTQEDLSDTLGVSAVTVSRYERGDRQPSPSVLKQIADALGVSVDELREIDREVRPDDAPNEPVSVGSVTTHVTSRSDISAWRDRVVRDPSLNEWAQVLLMALPIFLDRTSWVVAITLDQFIRETGRTREMVEAQWQNMLDSEYIERIGENEWTLRLVFPD